MHRNDEPHPEEEPEIKAAFAELHQRQREQAPAFAPMRERALRTAQESRSPRWLASATTRLAWAGAACAMALVIWWSAQSSRHGGLPGQNPAEQPDVEKLISAIEQHLEIEDPGMEYPTDLLLVGDPANSVQ